MASTLETPGEYSVMLNDYGNAVLLINPESGIIVYANNASALFYGYSKEQLENMSFLQISTRPEIAEANLLAALQGQVNSFTSEHRLANGEARTVEVLAYPVSYDNQTVLFSVIHDISPRMVLQEQKTRLVTNIYIAGGGLIVFLLALVFMLLGSRKKLKKEMQRADIMDALRKAFIDVSESMIYLKDENLNYIFVNKAMEIDFHKAAEEIIGKDDFALTDESVAQRRRQSELAVLEKGITVTEELELKGRFYRKVRFPVKIPNGNIGVGAYITDITPEREREKKQQKSLLRHKIMLDNFTRTFTSMQEQLDSVLHEALALTESQYGYIYLYDEALREFTLNSWTSGVMDACEVAEKSAVYHLDNTGLWGEVVRQRKPIVVNDFEARNPLKKGYPEGHVKLRRFLSVPVIIDGIIVAVVGLANKQTDYDENDVYEMTLLMSGIWNAAERRLAQESLSRERNKYLKTLISISDGVMVVDQNGKVEMLNRVAEKLTGWSAGEAIGRHYREIYNLIHENGRSDLNDPIAAVLETDMVHEPEDYAVLVSKNGGSVSIEDSAAPVKDDFGATVGVVLVFRDVTEKKKQLSQIEYLSFHDSLTGLYNRRFFEEEMLRLDTERNLPVSIIIGDINGLKLTNDIFGHACGDLLLTKFAEVMKKVCRADDIIARWGGDEFVVLLPKTTLDMAEQIILRIKQEFSNERVKVISGSVSMGADFKQSPEASIKDALSRAEEKMYSIKTLERGDVLNSAVDAIIEMLQENCPGEKLHSDTVSMLCQEMGKSLDLPETEVKRLEKAGYLHDIGKIALDPVLLNKSTGLTAGERSELRNHPVIGYRILNFFNDTLDLSEIVLAHHEQWDGLGYPKGLKGKEIPLLSRIIFIADLYERTLHDAKYSGDSNRERAMRVIRDAAGKQLDPALSELFLRMIGSLDPGLTENH